MKSSVPYRTRCRGFHATIKIPDVRIDVRDHRDSSQREAHVRLCPRAAESISLFKRLYTAANSLDSYVQQVGNESVR